MAATSSAELPTASCKRKAEASWGLTTGQDVLNLAAYKYLQTTDATQPEDLNGFVRYLEHVRKVVIVDVQPGSLLITVECGSLQILKELWHDYCTGYVSKMAQTFLLTKDILNELGISKVKFWTSIPEDKYRDCQEQLQAFDSGECKYFYKYSQTSVVRTVGYFEFSVIPNFGHLLSADSDSRYFELFFDSPESSK